MNEGTMGEEDGNFLHFRGRVSEGGDWSSKTGKRKGCSVRNGFKVRIGEQNGQGDCQLRKPFLNGNRNGYSERNGDCESTEIAFIFDRITWMS